MKKTSIALEYFLGDKKNGEDWRRILFEAPAYAMERIAVWMYFSFYGDKLTEDELTEYYKLVEEIESTFEKEDLEYLIRVMPGSEREHYRMLLIGLLDNEQPGGQKAQVQSALPRQKYDERTRIVRGEKEYHRISECLYGLKNRGIDKLHAKYNVGHVWVQENDRPDFISGLPIGIGLVIDEVGTWDSPPVPSGGLIDDISHMIGRKLRYVKTFNVGNGRYSHSYVVLAKDGNKLDAV